MERIISGIVILIIILNVVYTITVMVRFCNLAKSNSVKMQILAPISVIIFGFCMYIIFGFNLYYYLVKNSIENLLSSVLCIVMANQVLINSFYALNEKVIIIKSEKLNLSKIQDIDVKKTFVFIFLEIAILKIENKPQISFFISKKVKKMLIEGNWYKGSKIR